MAVPTIYVTTTASAEEGGVPPSVAFDAVLSFNPSFSQAVTKFTLSDGSFISNHTTRNNDVLQVTGVITTQPLRNYDGNLVGYDTLEERPQLGYNQLKQWFDERIEVYVAGEYDIFPNLIITSLQPVQEGTDSLTFNVTFEAVRRATYQRVIIVQNLSTDKALDAQPNSSKSTKKEEQDPGSNLVQVWEASNKFLADIGAQ